MSKLAKWLPFRFQRKKEPKPDDSAAQVPVRINGGSPSGLAERMSAFLRPDVFWRDPFSLMGELDQFFGDFTPHNFAPSIDLVDEGKHVRLTAELPGVEKDDIDLTVTDELLTLRGQKKHEHENDENGCYRLERYFGQFQRAIPLPNDVVVDGIEATFDKGVLTVRMPKGDGDSGGRRVPIG